MCCSFSADVKNIPNVMAKPYVQKCLSLAYLIKRAERLFQEHKLCTGLTASDPMETDMPSSENQCCPALTLRCLWRRSCNSSRRLCTSRLLSARATSSFSACKQITLWYVWPGEGLSDGTNPTLQTVRQALICVPCLITWTYLSSIHWHIFQSIQPSRHPAAYSFMYPFNCQSSHSSNFSSNHPAIHISSHLSV